MRSRSFVAVWEQPGNRRSPQAHGTTEKSVFSWRLEPAFEAESRPFESDRAVPRERTLRDLDARFSHDHPYFLQGTACAMRSSSSALRAEIRRTASSSRSTARVEVNGANTRAHVPPTPDGLAAVGPRCTGNDHERQEVVLARVGHARRRGG